MKNYPDGFSLFEILIVLSILGIIATLSISNLQYFVESNSATAKSREILSMLEYARLTAVATRRSMLVCPATINTCQMSSDKNIIMLSDDRKLFHKVSLERGLVHFRSFTKRKGLSFNALGFSDNGTVWYCSLQKKIQWALIVNKMGRIRFATPIELKNLAC